MKLLLLGSKGFIGKSLCRNLKYNHHVVEVSRETDLSRLFEAQDSYDYIINCISSIPTADAETARVNNFFYPKQFVEKIRARGWIQLDSYLQLQIPMGRNDPYTLEKQNFSEYLDSRTGIQNSPAIHHLYLPHVFGEGDRPERLISSAISTFINGDIFETSSGTQLLPILHISDAVSGIIKYIENPHQTAFCQPFWYGSVKALLDLISSQFINARVQYGSKPNPIDANFSRVDLPHFIEDWEPKMQLTEFLEWVRVQNVG